MEEKTEKSMGESPEKGAGKSTGEGQGKGTGKSTGESAARGTGKSSIPAVRIMAALLVVILAVSACVGLSIWKEYRDSIIDRQKQQMLLTVQSLSDSMEVFISEYSEDLDGLWRMTGGQMQFGRPAEVDWSAADEYVDSHRQFVYDVVAENENGEILKSTKGYRIEEIYSLNRISSTKTLLQAKLDNGEMYLVMQMSLEHGSISIVIDLEKYYETLIRGLRIGSSGYIVVKDADGVIIMHPEKAQWGINVISGRMEMYPDLDLESLNNMIEDQKKGHEGVAEYYSYWWPEPGHPRARKISSYAPVQIGRDFLIVSAVMDYDDIYIPMAEGVLKLLSLFGVIFVVMAVMAAVTVRLFLQRQKDTEQIAYLLELNRLLEEMHRSEETIAHQQRLQIMGTMTGGIAHEFNNLLTPIMGYADLLMMDLPEDSEEYDNALEIYEASVKAKEIIQQISSLSRKNMETAYKITDAAKMMTRALKMVRSVCPSNVRMEEDIRLDGACILCNETQMNQVILNVCVNAIHAIDHREGWLKISGQIADRRELEQYQLSSVPENWSRYVRVDIRDNGCGMSKEVLSQIFDPFFTTKKGGKGTGLGLSLVEQIISSHKGFIFAESKPGEGSTFHIYLPVSSRKAETVGRAGEKNGDKLRLLVVDDNPKVLKLLERDASRLHVSLLCCMNFGEAEAALEKQEGQGGQEFAALVAEQDISGHSAVDFCMSIQGRYPDIEKIVMTDRVTKEIAEAKQHRIIDGYVDKPVSVSSILEAIKENLNNL